MIELTLLLFAFTVFWYSPPHKPYQIGEFDSWPVFKTHPGQDYLT